MLDTENLRSLIDNGKVIGTTLENDKRSAIQGSIFVSEGTYFHKL